MTFFCLLHPLTLGGILGSAFVLFFLVQNEFFVLKLAIDFVLLSRFFLRHDGRDFDLSHKESTDVTDTINDGSVLFKCPGNQWQCDSEPACTVTGP